MNIFKKISKLFKFSKWIGIVGIVFITTLILNAGLPVMSQPINHILGQIGIKSTFTIAPVGTVYAATADYTVDGTADDVQAQAALNALPSTGGKLIFFGGNYNFAATVSRAINNVTIEGSGKSTYFAFNAGTALFSAGAQTGWVFKDFRTDAGWVTVSSAGDTLLAGNLWKGTSLISNVVASGATMPASPVRGQQFLQSTTGRTVLYTYNGSAWSTDQTYGTTTLYVDKTDGTDDLNHGTGVDANAFKTFQYAIDFCPLNVRADETITINLNGESYLEDVEIYNKNNITVVGTLSGTDLVATGGAQGAAPATPSTVTGAFAVGAHDGKLLKFTSGANSGTYRIIGQTTATDIYLVGNTLTAAPVNLDTFTVYTWATTVQSIYVAHGTNVIFRDICLSSAAGHPDTGAVIQYFFASGVIERSKVVSSGASVGIMSAQSFVRVDRSFVNVSVAGDLVGINVEGEGTTDVYGSKLLGAGAGNGSGVRVRLVSNVQFRDMNEISGFTSGVYAITGSIGSLWSSGINHFIHGNSIGVNASVHGQCFYTSSITYGTKLAGTADVNTIANESADATSFSYVD